MLQLPRDSGLRSEQMIGKAPLSAKARAMARPRPEEAPVMMVTREARRFERRDVVIFWEEGSEKRWRLRIYEE